MVDETQVKAWTDCFFFLQGKCTKATGCEFRHCAAALATVTPCKYWAQGKCTNLQCPYRHPTRVGLPQVPSPVMPAAAKDRSKIQCYWETQPGGCGKGAQCPFLHLNPQQQQQQQQQQQEVNAVKHKEIPMKVADTRASSSTTISPPKARPRSQKKAPKGTFVKPLYQIQRDAKLAAVLGEASMIATEKQAAAKRSASISSAKELPSVNNVIKSNVSDAKKVQLVKQATSSAKKAQPAVKSAQGKKVSPRLGVALVTPGKFGVKPLTAVLPASQQRELAQNKVPGTKFGVKPLSAITTPPSPASTPTSTSGIRKRKPESLDVEHKKQKTSVVASPQASPSISNHHQNPPEEEDIDPFAGLEDSEEDVHIDDDNHHNNNNLYDDEEDFDEYDDEDDDDDNLDDDDDDEIDILG